MAQATLELYRWLAPVDGGNLPELLRRMERRVIEGVGPALRDPVVREHAVSYWVDKRHGAEGQGPENGPAGVVLTLVAPPEAAGPLGTAVERHAGSVRPLDDDPELAPLLHPISREYRQGLRDVTDLALDLHLDDETDLTAHQCFLIRVGCNPADPRYELHPHLLEHSETYAASLGHAGHGGGPWAWGHEELWARLFTPGPSMGLPAPLVRLWSTVLGLIPERGWTPEAVARRMGLECP